MARKNFSDDDILKVLRQIELDLTSGKDIKTACRSAGISDTAYYTGANVMEGWVAVSSPR